MTIPPTPGKAIPADDHGGTCENIIDLSWPAEPPVIYVIREGVQLTFRCRFCRRNHWHGAHGACTGCDCELHEDYQRRGACTCPIGAGDGHRAAHCTSEDSPYRHVGYVLIEVKVS
jgi:hypothetical protein